jgi:type VI secretion system protein VasG
VVIWVAGLCLESQSGARDIDKVLNQHILPLLADTLLHEEKVLKSSLKIGVSKNKLVTWSTYDKK